MEFVGLIPAGGLASRMGLLPCSKEVFPLFTKGGKISVTSSNLLRYFQLASITNIFFIIRKGKWDIPEYFSDGSDAGINIGYLIMNLPYGTPFTLNQAYPFIKDKIVGLGFPDIIFEPEDAFVHLKAKLLSGKADIVLGIVPCEEYLKSDMLEMDENGEIRQIIIKQDRPDLKYSWFIAIWRPAFTTFMHTYLATFLKANPSGKVTLQDGSERELYVGDVIQSAISAQLNIEYLLFPEGKYNDLGTPTALFNRKF